jgi:hypothetical protein
VLLATLFSVAEPKSPIDVIVAAEGLGDVATVFIWRCNPWSREFTPFS